MKRKLFACILCAVLLFAGILPAAAQTAKYVVTASYANVLPDAEAALSPIATLPQGTVVEADEIKNNFAHVTLRSGGITGWVYLPLLSFCGEEAQNTAHVKNIYVSALPDKTEYIEGEEAFAPEGLQIFASYTDGRPDAPVTGYKLYLPDFNTYGEKTVYVSYTAPGGAVFGTSFLLTVVKVPVGGLTFVSLPAKTAYIEGQALDLTGLAVRVDYTDGRGSVICTAQEMLENKDFIITGCHNETHGTVLKRGDHTVHIYYKYPEIHASFAVSAKKKTLVSLSVATEPDSLVTYSNQTAPDLTGLTLAATYDNGITETVLPDACTVVCDPSKFVLGPGNRVTVKFGGMEVTLEFTLALDNAVSLELATPKVLNFILGEKIDLRELHAYLIYASGQRKEVQDYKISKIDPQRTGPQTVTVSYNVFSEVFTINISPYYQRGDVDNDGQVTANDARLALRHAVDLIHLAGNPFQAADADRDDQVTAADARLILRAAVDLEQLLHFENIILLNKGVRQ